MSIEFELIDLDTKAILFASTNVAEVNIVAARLKGEGKKVRMQKKADTRDPSEWHAREQGRFDSGHYKPLPLLWRNSTWFKKGGSPTTQYHFPHFSKNGENVAYIASDEHGFEDHHTILAPSRYLAKFYAHVLRAEEISKLSNAFLNEQYVMEILFAPSDFAWAYQQINMKNPSSGHDSCMGYNKGHFGLEKHPSEIYGAGDLGIAVIRDLSDKNKILARCIVYPKTKAANRVYGVDERMRDILLTKLKEQGFAQEAPFQGAKLQAVRVTHVHGRRIDSNKGTDYFIMPYIDGEYACAVWGDTNDHFTLTRRSRHLENAVLCQSTAGYIGMPRKLLPNEFRCERCAEVSTVKNTVHVNGERTTKTWCRTCVDHQAFTCHITNTLRSGYAQDDVMVSVNPIRHVTGWIDSEHVAECYRTGEFFDVRVFGPLVPIVDANGRRMEICSAFRVDTDTDYIVPAPHAKKAKVAKAPTLSDSSEWTPMPARGEWIMPRQPFDLTINYEPIEDRILNRAAVARRNATPVED